MTPNEANSPTDRDDESADQSPEWFCDDELWSAAYPFFFTDEKFDQARVDVNHVLTIANPAGRAVLDLCCGPGRFAIPLAERGFRVTGVDRSGYLLEKARSLADGAGVDVEWVLEDMRDFVRPEAFDVALSMFTSFGYFAEQEQDVQVLRNVYRSLKPGGALVVDVFGKEVIASHFIDTGRACLDDGTLLFESRHVIDGWTRIRNEWTMVSGHRARAFHFTVRVYSGAELSDALKRAGFTDVSIFGDLEGEPYDRRARRLVAVGKKAA